MRVVHYTDGESFARRVMDHLAAAEVENNLILGVIEGIQSGLRRDARMMLVEDGGEIQLVAVMTPPYNLVLSNALDEALQSLVEDLWARGLSPAGAVGLAESSEAFARHWRRTTGQGAKHIIHMQLYTAREVSPPRHVPGTLRAATGDDLELVVDWLSAFSLEAHVGQQSRDLTRSQAARRIDQGQIHLWQNGGAAVCFAGYHPIPPRGARIGPVYTPPELRGRGYASACVGYLARRALDGGRTWCGLFADLANPVSNRIYQRLGFRESCRYKEHIFDGKPVSPQEI